MSLNLKIALITGAGSGIGQAVSQLFAKEGAQVIAADINVAAAQITVATLQSTLDRCCHLATHVDVADSNSVETLSKLIIEKYKEPPSIVVNCAGILETYGGLFNTTEYQWDRTIDINLKGTFLIDQKFAMLMKQANIRGSIVNISSTAAAGAPWCPDYSASKAGVIALTKSIAKELGPLGIRVNCVQPGPVDTPLGRSIDAAKLKALEQEAALKRLGTPQEIADLCLFLVSDKSSYMTGSVVQISGGLCR